MNRPPFVSHKEHKHRAQLQTSPIYMWRRKTKAVRKSLGQHLLDIIIALLLFVAVATAMRAKLRHDKGQENTPTGTDLTQQRQMIEYHHSQGRDFYTDGTHLTRKH